MCPGSIRERVCLLKIGLNKTIDQRRAAGFKGLFQLRQRLDGSAEAQSLLALTLIKH